MRSENPAADAVAQDCATRGIAGQYNKPITAAHVTEQADDFERRWLALTRACRPQTNGKVERFNRTLLDEWAYTSNTQRTEALADFLHTYNHHRCHTALGGHPPSAA